MTVDADGNRASISLAGVYTLYYQYTQRQQMSLVSTSTAAYYGFTYDLNGNMTKQQDKLQGLDSTSFAYDALDRVTLCTQTGANDVSFAWSHYDYDLNNNIQDTYRDEQAGKGERFGYDYANQLSSAVYNADNVQTPNPTNYDRSVSYTCDALNRTSMNDNGAVTNYTPNGLNQLTAVTGMQSTYDQNFNQKKINGWVYTYDAARRVGNAANSATGHSTQFSYDGLNRCVQRVTDGVTTLITYDGWKPIAEWDGNGALVAWNIYGPDPDQILMRYRASDASYLHYHADQFGSVKFLLNSANTGIEKYTYDAFGAPKITDWAGNVRSDSAYGNRFMFTGREYLSTIGIYDYRNRMYSPLLGRFLQNDPLRFDAGDNNLYRYVGHNPVNKTDSSGLRCDPDSGICEDDGASWYPKEDWWEAWLVQWLWNRLFPPAAPKPPPIPEPPVGPYQPPPTVQGPGGGIFDGNGNPLPDGTGTWGGTYMPGTLLQRLSDDAPSKNPF
jgi:RHS repeat-associated protein